MGHVQGRLRIDRSPLPLRNWRRAQASGAQRFKDSLGNLPMERWVTVDRKRPIWESPSGGRSHADAEHVVHGQFSRFQSATFQIEGLKSRNHCLCSLQNAL